MADRFGTPSPVKMPTSASPNVDMDSLVNALDEQERNQVASDAVAQQEAVERQRVTQQKAVGSVRALTAARQVQEASFATGERALESKQYIMDDAQQLAIIEQEAIKLSNSGNPADRLTLFFKQIKDPRYTKEYNSTRQSKLAQSAGLIDSLEAAEQQRYARQLKGIQSEFELASAKADLSLLPVQQQKEMADLITTQGQNVVDSLRRKIATRAEVITQDKTLQTGVLDGMTDDQVKAAQQSAAKTPDKVVNVGGVNLTAGILDAEADKRNDMAFNRLARQAAMATQNEAWKKTERTKSLQLMSTPQLEKLILNGGRAVDPVTGQDDIFDLDEAKKTYDLKKAFEQDSIMQQAQLAGIGDPKNMVVSHQDFINKTPMPAPGTEMFTARSTYQVVTGMAGNHVNSPEFDALPPAVKNEAVRAMNDSLGMAQSKYYASVEKEAKRVGAGNEFRTELEKSRLMGEPAPTDLVEKEVLTRLQKNAPLTDLFGPEGSGRLLTKYNKIYQNKRAEANPLGNPSTAGIDYAGIKAEAASEAYQEFLKESAREPATALIYAQVADPTHPLYGQVSAQEFGQMDAQAQAEANQEFQQQNEIKPDDWASLMAGGTVEIHGQKVNRGDIGPTLGTLQASALFGTIAQRFGMDKAEAMTNWLGSDKASQYADRAVTQMSRNVGAKGAGPAYVNASVTTPVVKSYWDSNSQTMQMGLHDFQADRNIKQVQSFRGFGNSVEGLQVALLSQDDSLSDRERQEVYTKIITPLIAVAKKQSFNNDAVNRTIDEQLYTLNPEDPALKTLLKKFLRTRDDSRKAVQKVLNSQSFGDRFFNGELRLPWAKKLPGGLSDSPKWFEDLQSQKAK